MMGPSNESRELRTRLGRLDSDLAGLASRAPIGQPNYAGRVYAGPAYSGGGSPGYYLTHPLSYSGPMVEGAAPSTSVDTSVTVPVAFLDRKPEIGEDITAGYVTPQGRWVADRRRPAAGSGGYPTGDIPSCFCTHIPGLLSMTSADESCNYGMFRTGSIAYGPTPAVYSPLNLGTNAYLGEEQWPDTIANGASFRYFLTCQYNQFNLSRVYETSPYGTPYRDAVLFSWIVGGAGNTCHPFTLGNGVSFPGSDGSCDVTISG